MDKDKLPAQNSVTTNSEAEDNATCDSVSIRRRRFIRASAAAVPVILTLRSGAAAAAASMDCRDNDAQAARANPPDSVLGDLAGDPAHDQWLRIFANVGKKITATVKFSGNVTVENGVYYLVERKELAPNNKPVFDYFDGITGALIDKGGITNQIDSGDKAVCYYVYADNGWECTVDEGVVGGCNSSSCTVILPSSPLTVALTGSIDTKLYKEVQLLVSVSWSADGQTATMTYYPQKPLAGDYAGAPITDSCWCSVSPDFTPQA